MEPSLRSYCLDSQLALHQTKFPISNSPTNLEEILTFVLVMVSQVDEETGNKLKYILVLLVQPAVDGCLPWKISKVKALRKFSNGAGNLSNNNRDSPVISVKSKISQHMVLADHFGKRYARSDLVLYLSQWCPEYKTLEGKTWWLHSPNVMLWMHYLFWFFDMLFATDLSKINKSFLFLYFKFNWNDFNWANISFQKNKWVKKTQSFSWVLCLDSTAWTASSGKGQSPPQCCLTYEATRGGHWEIWSLLPTECWWHAALSLLYIIRSGRCTDPGVLPVLSYGLDDG